MNLSLISNHDLNQIKLINQNLHSKDESTKIKLIISAPQDFISDITVVNMGLPTGKYLSALT